ESTFKILSEQVRSFAEAARSYPEHENRPSSKTLWRWFRYGLRVPSGGIIRLEAARIGGRWVTSLEALARFDTAGEKAHQPPGIDNSRPKTRPTSRRRKQVA